MNFENHIDVNCELLVWARVSIAMSKNQVVEKTQISLSRLNHLEDGIKKPSLEELRILSKVYKRTVATLLLSNPPYEKPLPKDRRSVDSKSLGSFHEKTIIAVRKSRAIIASLVELKKEANIPIKDFEYIATFNDSPKKVAKDLFDKWRLGEIREEKNINKALDYYIEKIESLGVGIVQLALTQDNLRGFAIIDDVIPIIGIKRGGEPASAKIFTLFHELGHILLREDGLCDISDKTDVEIEKWCNSFAAEILIPTSELLKIETVVKQKLIGNKIWDKKTLVELSSYFHVGPLAILRSLLENGLTTVEYYENRHIAWNKPQFGRAKIPEGRNIPKETIKEKGKTYLSLAFSAFDQNRIDIKVLSDFLGIKVSYISKTRQLLNA
jgi:Zn-dependent peptidase ImmA (M78 family)